MEYRQWQNSDVDELYEIEKQCFKTPWTPEMISSSLKLKNFYGTVCVDNQKIVGYVGSVCDDWDAEILNVAVVFDYRRRGIAKRLLEDVISRYTALKKEKLYLEVRASNDGARILYSKLGFEPIGIRKKYYENTEDAIVMAKLLNGD